MKIKIEVDIAPFDVPHKVYGNKVINGQINTFELNKLTSEQLGKLCDEFRKNVFLKAGLKDDK
jgi:hypothetical protein